MSETNADVFGEENRLTKRGFLLGYGKKALMFGDGRNGARLQIYGIFAKMMGQEEALDTRVRIVASKRSRHAEWREKIVWGRREYETHGAALDAWEDSTDELPEPDLMTLAGEKK